jgi:hypothetical protein
MIDIFLICVIILILYFLWKPIFSTISIGVKSCIEEGDVIEIWYTDGPKKYICSRLIDNTKIEIK